MPQDFPIRRVQVGRQVPLVPDGIESWIRAVGKAGKRGGRILVLAYIQPSARLSRGDFKIIPVGITQEEIEKTFPDSEHVVLTATMIASKKLRTLESVFIFAWFIDLESIKEVLSREYLEVRIGMLVNASIPSGRLKLPGGELEIVHGDLTGVPNPELDEYRGRSMPCRITWIDEERRRVGLRPAALPDDTFVNFVSLIVFGTVIRLIKSIEPNDFQSQKLIARHASPPALHELLAKSLKSVDRGAITDFGKAIGALRGIDDKASETCLTWLMERAKLAERNVEVKAVLPSAIDASTEAVRECLSQINETERQFKLRLAVKIQTAINRLGEIVIPEVKSGREIAILMNDCLAEFGFRFALSDFPNVPGTLECYQSATEKEPYFVVRRRQDGVPERPKIGFDFSRLLVIPALPDGRRKR